MYKKFKNYYLFFFVSITIIASLFTINQNVSAESTMQEIPFHIDEGRGLVVKSNYYTYMSIVRQDTGETVAICTSCTEIGISNPSFSADAYLVTPDSVNKSDLSIESGYDFQTAHVFNLSDLDNPMNPNGNKSVWMPDNKHNYFKVYLESNKKYLWFMNNAKIIKTYDENQNLISSVNGDKTVLTTTTDGFYYIYTEKNLGSGTQHTIAIHEMLFKEYETKTKPFGENISGLTYNSIFNENRSVEIYGTNLQGMGIEEFNTMWGEDSLSCFDSRSDYRVCTLNEGLIQRFVTIDFNKANTNPLPTETLISLSDGSSFEKAYKRIFMFPENNAGYEPIIIPANESSYYAIKVEKDKEYQISYGDTYGYVLYDNNKIEVQKSDVYTTKSTNTYDRQDIFKANQDGTYYIKLIGQQGSKSHVSLVVNRIYSLKDLTTEGIDVYTFKWREYNHRYAIRLNHRYRYNFGFITNDLGVEFRISNNPFDNNQILAGAKETRYDNIREYSLSFKPTEDKIYYLELNADRDTNIKFSTSSDYTGKVAQKYLITLDKYAENDSSYVSDPIDSSSGAFVTEKELLTYNSYNPLTFKLFYNSLLLNNGDLGKGWTHDYQIKMTESWSQPLTIEWSPNRKTVFKNIGNKTYIP